MDLSSYILGPGADANRKVSLCGIQFGRLETLRLAFFEIAGQRMSIKSAVSRIAGHDRSKDLYRRRGYCQSIRQIGQKP